MNALAPSFIVEQFVAVQRHTLRGFCRIRMPSGMVLHDVAIHQKGEAAAWAAPASKPQLDRDGNVKRAGDGKIQYVPIVAFASRELRDKFSKQVIEAVRRTHPEAFDPELAEAGQ